MHIHHDKGMYTIVLWRLEHLKVLHNVLHMKKWHELQARYHQEDEQVHQFYPWDYDDTKHVHAMEIYMLMDRKEVVQWMMMDAI